MSRLFYGRLAISNLKKNARLYLPYVLAAIGISAMYYIMEAIARDEGISEMPGSGDLRIILALGCGVITIFAVIFLFYTNSFLIKRRKREFGLFNILGMEKRHIARMMFWEMFVIAGISIVGGLIVGIVLNKMVVLVLMRLLDLDVPFGFSVSKGAMVSVAVLFAIIFAATLLYNLFQVQKAKPIELLRSASQGEKEPKTRWLMTIIGLLTLAGGYGIAITVEDPMSVLLLFFLAVVLVMAGTYCLFTAGSIAVLKLLRRNRNYYYKSRHFTSVSGMIYRMKQNAVGLSNICILSTMVLVMVSGTVALYTGIDAMMNFRYPMEIEIKGNQMTNSGKESLQEIAGQAAADLGLKIENISDHTYLSFAMCKDGEKLDIQAFREEVEIKGEWSYCVWFTQDEYEKISGRKTDLKEDEILVYTKHGNHEETQYQIIDKIFQIREYLTELDWDIMGEVVYDSYYLVVKDDSVLKEVYDIQKSVYGEHASEISYLLGMDISGEAEDEIAYAAHAKELLQGYIGCYTPDGGAVSVDSRADRRKSMMTFTGGFLFLGIFLGLVFLMATVLIIYYKQISEGYEDKERFEIMQKVGMSKKEVRASIRSQVLKVFFLPLVMACIHLAAAFPMMRRLLVLFGMIDVVVLAVSAVVTVGIFAVIYMIVYGITARSYYKIVES